jgi:hypothetical protein
MTNAKLLPKPRPARKQQGPARKAASTPHDLMVIPRDHIIPFRANVFGLKRRGEPEAQIKVFDPDRRPSVGDAVVILWFDKSRRPEFGHCAAIEYGRLWPKRVQLLKRSGVSPMSPDKEVRWFKLGPADLLAREIGTFTPRDGGGSQKEGWPHTYEKLCSGHGVVRTKEQWDLAQVFEVDNPADSPWPGWERLSVDPDAPLGPDSWVAAIEIGTTPKKRKYCLGKVAALKQSFEIEDVVTGKRVKLGGPRQPYHGVVIGMSRSTDALKRVTKQKNAGVGGGL